MRQSPNEPVRTCILSRDAAPRTALIRLALGPDGDVMPDLAAKAPGRGAWLGVDAPTLRIAQGKGQLKGALVRAFKGDVRSVPDDLAASIMTQMQQRTMDTLGLAMKAGHLIFGFERVRSAAKSGTALLLLHAADAAQDGRGKLDRAQHAALQSAGRKAKSLTLPLDRAALSVALGQGNVVHVAVTDKGAAERVEAAADRWRAFSGLDGEIGVSAEDAAEGIEG
ncbi:DUF448 domain-containing protein [Pacificimonas sp. WHA3]|uniref:DUF448 domain-containing protein n=1 Tax=Pacificimonas pallii TaxID=2827236 RepID=A0ABS6SC03_9SPHN|nr:DUF448 domain-containing protein [Pacificimonas pallii]MBV7255950.1 DUF448 domain-containing protein [Pacificimonas pallii]